MMIGKFELVDDCYVGCIRTAGLSIADVTVSPVLVNWSSRCIGTRRKLQLHQQYDAILRAVGGTVCAQCRSEWRQ